MNGNWKYSIVVGIALLLAFAVAQAANAQTTVPTPKDIIVGGVWAFNITQSASGMTADERVIEVRRRITEVLSKYRTGQDVPVRVRPLGASAAVEVGDMVVVTVTPADASATGIKITTLELARQWARRLHQGVSKALPDAVFHVF
jgi:hypothetical protein